MANLGLFIFAGDVWGGLMDEWPDYDGKHEPPDPKWLRWGLILFCIVATVEMVRQSFALLSWWLG